MNKDIYLNIYLFAKNQYKVVQFFSWINIFWSPHKGHLLFILVFCNVFNLLKYISIKASICKTIWNINTYVFLNNLSWDLPSTYVILCVSITWSWLLHETWTLFSFLFPNRLNLIYLTLILHGIGTLMPWNMFITAKEVRKFKSTHINMNTFMKENLATKAYLLHDEMISEVIIFFQLFYDFFKILIAHSYFHRGKI